MRSSLALLGTIAIFTSAPLAWSSAALAQSDCGCIISAGSGGPVGNISRANGSIYITGSEGLVPAKVGTSILPSDILSTASDATATAEFGQGCALALGGSVALSISPAPKGKLCVRIEEEITTGQVGNGARGWEGRFMPWVVGGGAMLPPMALALGRGHNKPISKH